MTKKFNVGDRVVCTKDHHGDFTKGREVVVVEYYGCPYEGKEERWFDTGDPDECYGDDKHFELALPFWLTLKEKI